MEKRSRGKIKGKKVMLFAMLVGIIVVAIWFFIAAEKEVMSDEIFSMSSNAERVEFLNKQGYIVKPEAIRKEEILIPADFNELYNEYAEFQKSQGFDISKYKGKEATLFSYMVLNYPGKNENVIANMLIIDGKLIGGEITLDEENGFTEPLLTNATMTLLDPSSEELNLL